MAAYQTVTLSGTYQTPDGTPHKGHVEIIPSERVIKDTTGDVILTGRVKVDLDAQGAFSVALPATDDETLNPTGFGYTIAAKLHSSHPPAVSFSLPAALGATTVEDLTPVDPSTFAPTTTYAEKTELDAVAATIPTTAADVNALPDTTVIPTTPGDIGAEPAGLSQATQDTLSGTYAKNDIPQHLPLVDDIRRSKGGVVGTNGKPVVSFRIDHGIDQWLSTFWPEFKARGIPASVGVVTDSIENLSAPYEPTTTTWATLLAEHRKGFEVWSHTRSHLAPYPERADGHTVKEEVVGSKAELEARGFRVVGWQQGGVPGLTTPHYSNNWVGDWSTEYGQWVLGTYGLINMNGAAGGQMRVLPTNGDYDLGHYTMDSMPYSTMQATLDEALAYGLTTQWMMHPKFIVDGTVTATTADVIQFLDYVKAKWDAGEIEVLTASGLAFADPGTSRRLDLARDGSFNGGSFTNGQPWAMAGGSGTGITIKTDGGHTGSNYLHIPASASYTYVYQGNTKLAALNVQGATFMVEVWARCTVANTEARIFVQDANDPTRLNIEHYKMLTAGSGWQRLRVPFSLPLATTNVQVRVARRGGTGDIDFDDLSIKAV